MSEQALRERIDFLEGVLRRIGSIHSQDAERDLAKIHGYVEAAVTSGPERNWPVVSAIAVHQEPKNGD